MSCMLVTPRQSRRLGPHTNLLRATVRRPAGEERDASKETRSVRCQTKRKGMKRQRMLALAFVQVEDSVEPVPRIRGFEPKAKE